MATVDDLNLANPSGIDRRDGKIYYANRELPDGPWHAEPDRVEFKADGFPCLLNRNRMGAWCGYVGLSPGHPWHGKQYDALDAEVHGGLTYAHEYQGIICHKAEPGEADDLWWIGFDCAHAGDLIPGMRIFDADYSKYGLDSSIDRLDTYRTAEMVRAETESLARQARQAMEAA